MSSTFPLQLEFLNDIVLSQNIVYVPIPIKDYNQMRYDIEQYKKQIHILNKEINKLKLKKFKLLKKNKKLDVCDESEEDDIMKINSLSDLLKLLHNLEHPDIKDD
jgi:hypothetical protein